MTAAGQPTPQRLLAPRDGVPPTRTHGDRDLGGAAATLRQMARARSRVPLWSARLVFLLGMASIASAVLPRRRPLLDWSIDLLPPLGMATVSVVGIAVGFGLLIMARGLRHRKRRAWRAVVALLLVGIVVHLVRETDPVQTAISAVVTTVLSVSQDQFIGRGDRRSRRAVPVVFVSMTLACWLLGCLVTQADRDALVPGWSWSELAQQAVIGLVGLEGPVRFTSETAASHNATVLLGLGLITVVVTLLTLLRSSTHVETATEEDRTQVRALLRTHSQTDSLGYFATRDDKSFVFSPSEKSAVAYRVVSGVCLASGDPLGDVEAWPAAIDAWLRLTQQRAWVPGVLGASETGAEVYQRVGLDALEIGDEAVLDVPEFTLEGRPMRGVRQAVNRARRAGYWTRLTRVSDLPADHLDQVRQTSAAWRPHSTDRGFSMALSRFGAAEDPDAVIVEGLAEDGRLVAALQLVPWGCSGWSLDLMRRDPELDNGVMELLIVDTVDVARRQGMQQISLNFALFRSSLARGERIGAGPLLRIWVRLLLFVSRWWQIASLYRANAKLRPTWEPRFLCFAAAQDLGDIIFAAVQAEGFLTLPRVRRAPAGRLTGAGRS